MSRDAETGRPCVPVGVDVVDVRRSDAEGLATTILTARERRSAVGRSWWPLVCLATKEAVVKACGGRPPSFRHRGIEVAPARAAGPIVRRLAAAASEALAPVATGCTTVQLDAATAQWLSLRLSVGPARPLPAWRVSGWWCSTPEQVLSLVVAVPSYSGAFRAVKREVRTFSSMEVHGRA